MLRHLVANTVLRQLDVKHNIGHHLPEFDRPGVSFFILPTKLCEIRLIFYTTVVIYDSCAYEVSNRHVWHMHVVIWLYANPMSSLHCEHARLLLYLQYSSRPTYVCRFVLPCSSMHQLCKLHSLTQSSNAYRSSIASDTPRLFSYHLSRLQF